MKTRAIGRLRVYKCGAKRLMPEWLVTYMCKDFKEVKNPTLSKETRTKIAMLDLMDEWGELPCLSTKVEYAMFTSYWIYGPVLKYRPVRRRNGGD